MEKCVLQFAIDDFNIEVAKALSKEFDLPVYSFTMWEFNEQEFSYTEEELKAAGVRYSFPRFYHQNLAMVQGLSMDALDEKQRALESSLGIVNNAMLASYERTWMELDDYRSVRNLQLLNLMFVDMVLSEIDPVCFLGARECYLWNVFADACLFKGIPVFESACTRAHEDRRIFTTSQGQQLGMREAFEKLMAGDESEYSAADLAEVDAWFDSFVNRPAPPWSLISGRDSRSLVKCVKDLVTKGYKSIARNIRLYRDNKYDREAGMLESPLKTVSRWPAKALRMANLEYGSLLNSNPDLNRKFIYLPLHHTPEVTDLVFGRDYCHHEGYVYQLARRISSDYTIYVKDHITMSGLRPTYFYKNLSKIYNVELVDFSVDTFTLIRHCSAVAAVTGTAGWEAYLLGKPVLVLGDVFYNFLPNVFHANLYEPGFAERFAEYLNEFRHDPQECRAAARAEFLAAYKVETETGAAPGAVKAFGREFASLTKAAYHQWGDWLVENEPTAIRGRTLRGEAK